MVTISPTAATSSAAADSAAAIRTQADTLVKEKAAEDFDKFLLLMTEQLRQQDPLNPADATEFVAQLATFSSVEQSIKSNEKLDQLIAATSGLADNSVTTLIGKTVEAATGRVAADGQPVGFAYEPVADATRVVAQVRDATDRLLREIPLETGIGRLQGAWDGRDGDGNLVAAGSQTIEVLQYKGKEVITHSPAITESRVTEIRMEPSGAVLGLANGGEMSVSDIRAVRAGS